MTDPRPQRPELPRGDTSSGWVVDLAVLCFVALVARVAAQVSLGFYSAPEAWEYDMLARNLVSGQGFVIEHDGTTHRAFTFPLYPLMLAAVYWVTGLSPTGIGVLQALLGSVLVALIYAFARPMGRTVAILAAIAVATHPGLLIYSAKIHALNLHAVLAVAAALLARLALERPTVRTAIIAGVTTGIASLERASFVPTLGLGLALGGWRHLGTARTGALLAIWLALTIAFAAPWIVRNTLVVGSPVLTTTGNEALWRGNNPNATGGNSAADGRPMLDASPEMRERILGRADIVQDKEFREAAFAYMSADPGRTLEWTVRKLFYFWWSGPQVGENYPATWSSLYAAYYVLVVGLVLAGVTVGRRMVGNSSLGAILLTAVPVSLLQAVYYVEGRHRWAVEPLLLVLAAAGLVAVVGPIRRVIER